MIIGLCFVFAGIALVFCPVFYCCRSCGGCGGSEPRKESYDRDERRTAVIVMVVGFIMIGYAGLRRRPAAHVPPRRLMKRPHVCRPCRRGHRSVGAIIGLVCNSGVSTGINDMVFVVSFSMSEAATKVDDVFDKVDIVIEDLNNTVDELSTLVLEIPSTIVVPTLNTLLDNMITPVDTISTHVDELKAHLLDLVRSRGRHPPECQAGPLAVLTPLLRTGCTARHRTARSAGGRRYQNATAHSAATTANQLAQAVLDLNNLIDDFAAVQTLDSDPSISTRDPRRRNRCRALMLMARTR